MIVSRKPHGCPRFWFVMCQSFLEIDDTSLTRELWKALNPNADLTYALGRIEDTRGSIASVLRIAALLSPADLMNASERLVSRAGGVRTPGIIRLQERICTLTDKHGAWR